MTQTLPVPVALRHPSSPTAPSNPALNLLGPSAAMAQLWTNLRRLAPHVRVVLLTGEADCGQEAVAQVMLDLSCTPRRSFLRLTAAEADVRLLRASGLASLPADVFLFLPEIDRFSLEAQEAVVRLIRLRRSRPFTVVATTTKDLRPLVALGHFSPDLADVLGSVRLAIPALKERREDLPMLMSQIVSAASAEVGRPLPQLTEGFLRAAMQYSWPGNLGELTLLLQSLCTHVQSAEFTASDFHEAVAFSREFNSQESVRARMVSLETVMQEHTAIVLRACRGNKLKAAEVLGISRSTLYRMLDASASQKGTLQLAG